MHMPAIVRPSISHFPSRGEGIEGETAQRPSGVNLQSKKDEQNGYEKNYKFSIHGRYHLAFSCPLVVGILHFLRFFRLPDKLLRSMVIDHDCSGVPASAIP